MAKEATRRAPTFFSAQITLTSEIEEGTTKNGEPYMKSRNATVQLRGGKTIERTIMAFGPRFTAVQDCLVPGKPVTFSLQGDDGTLIILGLPKAKASL